MRSRSGSIVGSLVLIALGVLFLLGNVYPELRLPRLVARFWREGWTLLALYWPVILILWGLSKFASYIRGDKDPAVGRRSFLSAGDIVLLVFVLMFGTAITGFTRVWHGSSVWSQSADDFSEPFDSRKSFEYAEEVNRALETSNVSLQLENQHGNIEVHSHDSRSIRIRLIKKIRGADEAEGKEISAQLKIDVEEDGNEYTVSTNRDELPDPWQRGLKTDLLVWVPGGTALKIESRFGGVSVFNVAGNHEVTNSNGSVTLRDIQGNVKAENRYGPIEISRVSGNCEISSKFGPVQIETVGGKTDVENSYGPLEIRKLTGTASVTSRYGEVLCADLQNNLSVDAQYCSVKGQNISGDVDLSTSYKDVVLEKVLGSILVRGKHGDIEIKNENPPIKSIKVEAEYSGVDIKLPKNSNFLLEAKCKYGKILTNGFESLKVLEANSGKESHLRGSTGLAGPTITVVTSYRDIQLNPS